MAESHFSSQVEIGAQRKLFFSMYINIHDTINRIRPSVEVCPSQKIPLCLVLKTTSTDMISFNELVPDVVVRSRS